MKKIKFSGREAAVLRAIDFSLGASGGEIIERTHIEPNEALEILHGLMDTGYVETPSMVERINPGAFVNTVFEVNPAYAHDLREALKRI